MLEQVALERGQNRQRFATQGEIVEDALWLWFETHGYE